MGTAKLNAKVAVVTGSAMCNGEGIAWVLVKHGAHVVLRDISINTIQSRYRYGLDKLRSILNSLVNK